MTTIVPKKRINSIDALRGFALIGIMLLHCMERFDLTLVPEVGRVFRSICSPWTFAGAFV